MMATATSKISSTPAEMLALAVSVGTTGNQPAAPLTEAIAEAPERIWEIGGESIYDELTKALCGHFPHEALQWLHDAGLLRELLPELEATVSFSQEAGRRHKDVWEHTKEVTQQAVPRAAVRWAAVLHDIGKVPTRRFLPNGKVTFHGHAEEGVRMFRRGPARRITFPKQTRIQIEQLIRYHLRPGQYASSWTDSAVRRFAKEMGELLEDLLALGRADVTSKRPGKRRRCLFGISELARRIRTLQAEDAKPKALPAGLGTLLMKELCLPPGKHLAVLRNDLEARCEAGELDGGREADYYVDAVRRFGLLEGLELQPPRGFSDR